MAKNVVKPTRSAINFILQGKGGVGKSLIAAVLAQYLTSLGDRSVICIDTDPINQTFSSYERLKAHHIDLMNGSKIDERNFDVLMEKMLSEEGVFVVDNGASSFVPLSNYLIENDALAMLRDAGREVFIHCVVTGGQALEDTLAGFKSLAAQSGSTNLVVWLNEYFGAVESGGKGFTEMKAYIDHASSVRGIIRIPKKNPDTFGKDIEDMVTQRHTFDEAIESAAFSIMAKQRLKTVQRDIFTQLALVEL